MERNEVSPQTLELIRSCWKQHAHKLFGDERKSELPAEIARRFVLDYLNGEGHKVLRVHKHWQSLSDNQKETALSKVFPPGLYEQP